MLNQGTQYSANTIWVVAGGAALCGAVVWIGLQFAPALSAPLVTSDFPMQGSKQTTHVVHPLVEILKLVVAGLIGIIVTAVHKHYHRERPLSRSLEQAQILLCATGALMMILIGNSTARAFGIAGGASILRFRTPVDDPKDATVLFLMMGLGMACGLGSFVVAGLGAVFLCAFLAVLDRFGEQKQRVMMLQLVASGSDFPSQHVNDVLRRTVNYFEPREVVSGKEATVKYQVQMDQSAPLTWLSAELMASGSAGLKSVSWELPKKNA